MIGRSATLKSRALKGKAMTIQSDLIAADKRERMAIERHILALAAEVRSLRALRVLPLLLTPPEVRIGAVVLPFRRRS